MVKKIFFSQKGQSIIEALIALGVAVLIVSSITVAVITSVNNSDYSKNQNLATQYAQQGMEILRQQAQSNWSNFSNYQGTSCLNEGSSTLTAPGSTGCGQNISNFFVRQVNIVQNSGSCSSIAAKVTVSVSWTDGKCTSSGNAYCHQVSLDSCMASLNSAPTP